MSEQPRGVRGRFAAKLTAEVHERLVQTISAGVPIEMAASDAGVVRATFYNWMREGKQAIAAANGDLEDVLASNPYAALAHDVEEAQGRFVTSNMALIAAIGRGQAEGTWQALAWLLERRFPQLFGRRSRLDVSGQIVHQHSIALDPEALDRLEPTELRELTRLVEKMQGEVIDAVPLELTA